MIIFLFTIYFIFNFFVFVGESHLSVDLVINFNYLVDYSLTLIKIYQNYYSNQLLLKY